MKILKKMNVFYFFIILFLIKAENIFLWENNKEIIDDIIKDDIDNIYSYAVDDETGAELYLVTKNDKSEFILKDGSTDYIIKNDLNKLVEIRSPLIKLNSKYYCCSNESIIWTDGKKIYEKNKLYNNAIDLKCLRAKDNILVSFIGTPKLYYFDSINDTWGKEFIIPYVNEIYAINNYTQNNFQNYYMLVGSYKSNDSEYFFWLFKLENNELHSDKDINIDKKKIELYLNYNPRIELIMKRYSNKREYVTFLFTYVPNRNLYSIYNINLGSKIEFFEIKVFRFFNDFIIRNAGFILDTPFLYFSVESMINGQKYIGMIHIEYSLLIYNIEENINNILYYNYGKSFKDKGKLLYFSGNRKISFCPFIKNGDKCINNLGNNIFSISLNETTNLYTNKIETNCVNKNILDYYCLDNCPNGFTESNESPGRCDYCLITEENLRFFIGSKKCGNKRDCAKLTFEYDSSTCYDCTNSMNDKIYYKYNCINSCEQIHGEDAESADGNKYCISCKDKSTEDNQFFYSYIEKKCTTCENGIKNYDKNICIECSNNVDNRTLFFPDLEKCVESCDQYYAININNARCEYCENSTYYEKGKCVSNCNNSEGYAIDKDYINEKGKKINICKKCNEIDKSKIIYITDGYCSNDCPPNYMIIIDSEINLCINCNDRYYFINDYKCVDKCPTYSQIINNNTCSFCQEDYFYDNDTNSCNEKCKDYQRNLTGIYNNTHEYNYCENITCEGNMRIINGQCFNCSGNYYNPFQDKCYRCFCGGKPENDEQYECNQTTGQCNCPKNYYGYNCEFCSIDRIGDLKIISLNDRLIKTDKNFFTYEFIDNSTLSKNNYSFLWQLFFNETEITNNKKYKTYFITETNEEIFGINKEIFEEINNNIIYISLSIINKNKEEIEFYNKIKLILINSFDIISKYDKNIVSGLYYTEMVNIATLKREENKYEGRYLFQFDILDDNNEKLPLTNYMDTDSIDINLICSKRIDVNIKNDNNEILSNTIFDMEQCSLQQLKIDEILYSKYYLTEKIFLLKSFIKKNSLDEEGYIKIKEFIIENIPKIINGNGSFIELYDISKNITYSEPKTIFSLINQFTTTIKENITKIDDFFEIFNKIFESIFKDNIISNKTLSDLDIKSLFRTIDNLYDICIENNLTYKNSSEFVKILDNLVLYLSYKTYPSEIIRLIGNRISLLSYHLGNYQTNISFPYINDSNNNIDIKDFSTYSFDNYNLDEKICSQKNETLFCLTKDNYTNLVEQLSKNNKTVNNYALNIYLLQELNKDNEKVINDDSWNDEIIKILMKKNNSIIFRFIKKDDNSSSLVEDDSVFFEFDIEFPFWANLSENNEKQNEELNEDKKSIISSLKKKYGYDIPLSPDNSDYTCYPKSYYKNSIYYCFTHFDYKNKKVRCRCKTKLNDEVIIIQDKEISKIFKEKQFEKPFFILSNNYGLFIIYAFILFLIIPAIYFLIKDINKDAKKNKIDEIKEKNETKENYKIAKKYGNTGVLKFSFYLALRRFPYFSVFNKYYTKYPKYINHLIICTGLLIGFICPLIPYYFITFPERDIFVNQRSIEYDDYDIRYFVPNKYYILSMIFCFLGIFFGNLFIYLFSKILNFEKEEINIWLKIKTVIKDFIYYNVKSEVLLDSKWSKIQARMLAYYYICGNYILRRKRIKKNTFNEYLNLISRKNQEKQSLIASFNDLDIILPKTNNISMYSSIDNNNSIIISNKENKKKYIEMNENSKAEPLLINEEENSLLINNNIINDSNDFIIEKEKKFLLPNIQNNTIEIVKLDDFCIDKSTNYRYNKIQKERFEKVRNKYIYIRKKVEINGIKLHK